MIKRTLERCQGAINSYRRDSLRKREWVVFAFAFFFIGFMITLAVPHRKEEDQFVSFVQRMGNNARWWSQKSATASLCRTKEHVIEAKTNEPNATACPGSCISSDDFSVFEVPGVDYAALFDRTGSAIIIWVVSMVADVFVIGYHVKNRPHPKFTTTSPRMVSITIHSMSGAGECVAGLWTAFLVGDQRLAMIYYMSIFSLFHIVNHFLKMCITTIC